MLSKKKIFKIFKITFPLFIGILFVYLSVKNTTEEDRTNIYNAIKNANYRYIFFSLLLGLMSHISRAYRWNFMLAPMGYKPKLINNILAIFITYIANLGIPRSGELFRATIMKTYENIPFEKSFGTIISERIVDLTMLFIIIGVSLSIQYELIIPFLEGRGFNSFMIIIFLLFLFLIIGFLVKKLKKSNTVFALKVLKLLKGFKEGIMTLIKMPKRGPYIFHTLFIWILYVLMFYVVKWALPETTSLPFEALLIAFIVGALTISLTNGGIGVYPFSVSLVLIAYGVSKESSLAFGWIMWASQTVMVIFLGGFSFFALPIINRKK